MTDEAIRFWVPGAPIAKGRPKFAVRGGYAVAYTPKRTVRYESTVALAASDAMAGRPPIDAAVRVEIRAFFPIPASWPKKRRQDAADGLVAHTYRPDADNVTKAVLDGLAGILIADDSSVCDLLVQKRYSDRPGVSVAVMPWTGG